jgi:subtilisin family serine protease
MHVMTKVRSRVAWAAVSGSAIISIVGLLSLQARAQQDAGLQGLSVSAAEQIAAVIAAKRGFTDTEQKIDSALVFAERAQVAPPPGLGVAGAGGETIDVDIDGPLTDPIVAEIEAAGGTVIYASERWETVRATVPLSAVDGLAASPDVRSVRTADVPFTNAGGLTSQGYISHRANQVVNQGVSGSGVAVGVLSDSALPARVAALIASGDLPADTSVLPGQQGPANGSNEGTAIMEIVHDLAPGAALMFATAVRSPASFADNIIALQQAGARVIVDDVSWTSEGAFQDGIVAQAVNQVTAAGVVYVSSAGNGGSVTFGNSGVWEGDFQPNGSTSTILGEPGLVHNFGTVGSPQNFDRLIGAPGFISLQWSDPLGGSTNDYDLFILNSAGTTLKAFSVAAQTGSQNPYEAIPIGSNCGTAQASGYCPALNDQIIVVLYEGERRALRLNTHRGQLSIGTTGATFGHNAGANTVSTAATYWNSARTGTRPFVGLANPNEYFSSDGPRKIFFTPAGTPLTPGNFLFATNGGETLQKPDVTAADGVSTRTPGFLPFFGTSAAAPHVAGIAALIRSVQPGWTQAQVVDALRATALDSMTPGIDRDAGWGIVMALPAVQYAQIH